MPLREGIVDEVYIITSADYSSIYAANNICKGISRCVTRGISSSSFISLGWIIYNERSQYNKSNIERVYKFAESIGSKVIEAIPFHELITSNDTFGKTTIENNTYSEMADKFRNLASKILKNKEGVSPEPLSKEKLLVLAKNEKEQGVRV